MIITLTAEAITTAVAPQLLDAWTVDLTGVTGWPAILTSTDGLRIKVTVKLGRVFFTGLPPVGDCDWSTVAISVRADRPTEEIAAEVSRRLLPRYRYDYRRAAAQAAENERQEAADEQARIAAVHTLSEVLPGQPRRRNVSLYGATLSWWNGTDPSTAGCGDAEINRSGTSVDLNIRWLTPEAAARVLAALKEEK